MAIQFIDNQPLTWNTKEVTFDGCKNYNEHGCTYYANSDYLYAQWKQNPCGAGDNVFCNPNFTNSNPEKISNGNFNTGSTGWTLSNATYDSVNKRINFSNTSNGSMTYNDSFVTGSWYIVTVTVGGNTKGNLTISLRGATNYSTIYSPGIYVFYIQAGAGTNNLLIQSASIFNGWVDDVSVKLLGVDCTEFGVGPQDWMVLSPGVIKKVATYATNFYAYFNAGSSIGGYYKISVKVSGMSAGSLTLADGGTVFLTITQDGIYEFYHTVSSILGVGYIGINFSASADFNGTISDISSIQYANYFIVKLNSTDGGTNYDFSNALEYYNDYLTLKKELSLINPGCYELSIYDACGIVENDPLIEDPEILDSGKWSINAGYGSGTITSGKVRFNSGSAISNTFVLTSISKYPPFSTFVLNWSFSTVAWGDNTASVYLEDANGVQNYLVTPVANQTYSGIITLTSQNDSGGIAIKLVIQAPGTGGITYEIGSLDLQLNAYLPGRYNVYTSNCVTILDQDTCFSWVGGTNGEDAFGFHFDPNSANPFQIGARVNAMMINPKYKGELKSYNDSEGNNIVTKSKSDKYYTLFINYTDEHNHDWLRTAVLSDTVKIGSYVAGYNYFVSTDGDYQPEWPDTLGQWPTAQARVELIKKTGTIYNNNAR